MRLLVRLFVVLTSAYSALSYADAVEDVVRQTIARNNDNKIEVTSIRPTPVTGIYEVVSGASVFYTDATGRYAFVDGRLVDTQERKDLTEATLQRIATVDIRSLPLDLAFKTVRGDGSRQLVVFADPACSACRDLHNTLNSMQDVTIYVFPLPIIAKTSEATVAQVLCAPSAQRLKMWNDIMEGQLTIEEPSQGACNEAQSKLASLYGLGTRYDITSTPTLFLQNGQRIVGRIPADNLHVLLTAASLESGNPAKVPH